MYRVTRQEQTTLSYRLMTGLALAPLARCLPLSPVLAKGQGAAPGSEGSTKSAAAQAGQEQGQGNWSNGQKSGWGTAKDRRPPGLQQTNQVPGRLQKKSPYSVDPDLWDNPGPRMGPPVPGTIRAGPQSPRLGGQHLGA